ncbi:MAG: hypothetical protein IKZ41_07485 [Clostridia bacterium]|nr:hypothetical protein [Clostridia bacterium]
MKYIAHRGACLEETENTLAALEKGASYGAYAVECDPQFTGDGAAILFHDTDLNRMADDPRKIADLSYSEIFRAMEAAGKSVTTLDELIAGYRGASAVLFDLPRVTDEAFFRKLANAPFHTIAGVHALDEAEIAARFFPREDILAFMPKPEMAAGFAAAGVGNLRLWEQWLPEHPIAVVRESVPADREIWIMMADMSIRHPLYCMNGSVESLKKLNALGADGVLLNDIALMREGI